LAGAFVRWQHGAGPYWPYVCAAPFLDQPRSADKLRAYLSRQHVDARIQPASASPKQTASRETGLIDLVDSLAPRKKAAIIIDLPPTQTLPASSALRASGFHIVPIIQRWVADGAVLPCAGLRQLLHANQPRGGAASGRGVVLLLDGERAGAPAPKQRNRSSTRRFDNRYDYRICRFPPARLLLQDGIRCAYWISDSGIATDLVEYVQALGRAGILVEEHRL
jgi:hypothetical protein